jgi:multidrug efflux pump subunit AcrA (membrane-fusion protein)
MIAESSNRLRLILLATVRHSPRTLLPNRFSTIRSRPSFKIKEPLNSILVKCNMPRPSLAIATSQLQLQAGLVCDWWTPAILFLPAVQTRSLVITQLQPITVVFNVAEDHLGEVQTQLRQHKPLAVEAFDRSAVTKMAVGSLLGLDNQIDTSTGTVRFRGEFDNRDLTLFPNQFVNARLLVKTLKGSVLIPSGAIQRNGTRAFVFAVDKNTVSVRNITERSTDGVTTGVYHSVE